MKRRIKTFYLSLFFFVFFFLSFCLIYFSTIRRVFIELRKKQQGTHILIMRAAKKTRSVFAKHYFCFTIRIENTLFFLFFSFCHKNIVQLCKFSYYTTVRFYQEFGQALLPLLFRFMHTKDTTLYKITLFIQVIFSKIKLISNKKNLNSRTS